MVATPNWLRLLVRTRRWFRRLDLGQVAIVAGLLALLWAALLLNMQREYQRIDAAAWRESGNLARALDESLTRTFAGTDQTLLFLRELYRRDPRNFDLTGWAKDPYWTNGPVIQLAVNGPDGLVIASNLGMPATKVDISDRPHFTMQRDATQDRLFIGVPVLGRVSGRWTVNVTRRLITVDGKFDGIVMASIDVSYFDQLYAGMQIDHGMVMLLGTDGIIRARAPTLPGVVGRQAIGSEHLMLSGQKIGTYHEVDPIDGIERLVTYCRVGDLPLVVAVGQDADRVFAEWAVSRRNHGLAGLFISVLAILVALLLQRQRERRMASQTALAATLQNISQGILMVGAGGRIAVVNSRAIELLGLPDGLVHEGTPFRDLVEWQLGQNEFGPPDAVDPEFLRTVRSGDITSAFNNYERARADGRTLEIRTEILADGGAVRTYTDVTHRKRTEQALAAARDAAEAAGRARSEFLAVMSHEIRTPMNGIIGVSSLLLEMEMGPTERRYVQIIMDSGQHLLQLINDILDFSRLDAGRLDLEEAEFDLPVMLRSTIEMMAQEARAKGLELALEIAADLPQIAVGDAHRLRQVLLNLLGNAVKFTSVGRVALIARRVADGQDNVRLGFAVSDTGIGIPSDVIGKLFTEFTQVDSSITRRFGGSGLGLAISRRLVERMGGTIWVDSTLDHGSVFQFEVTLKQPAVKSHPIATPSAVVAELGDGPSLQILLAEDNDTNRLVTTRMLEGRGHVVTAASNGREAAERAGVAAFDLIVMDLMMPDMDGLAATRAIRALPPPFGTVPIIGLSASVTAEDEAACRAAGMDEFAAKPISAAQLAGLVARLGRRRNDAAMPGSDGAGLATAEFISLANRNRHALQDLADSRQMEKLAELATQIASSATAHGLSQLALSATWLAATAEAGAPIGARLADTIACLPTGTASLGH